MKGKDLIIGAHTSTAGGLHHALIEGKEIGASTVQIFTSNQRQWKGREIAKEELDLWRETREKTGLHHIMSHASYLINLAATDEENLTKSRKAFEEELHRSHLLQIDYVNFHPGAAKESPREEALQRVVDSLLLMEPHLHNKPLMILFEATAGQGTSLGSTFEELAFLVERTHKKMKVGVCIDTCHLFAAGYDLRTKAALDQTLLQFDTIVGLKHLAAFHINDSQKGLGSHVDRHAFIGKGEIGLEGFSALIQNRCTHTVPLILETPGGPANWKEEIALLRAQL